MILIVRGTNRRDGRGWVDEPPVFLNISSRYHHIATFKIKIKMKVTCTEMQVWNPNRILPILLNPNRLDFQSITAQQTMPTDSKPRVIVIGTGWAGYHLALELDLVKWHVTVISPEVTSTITPLLASTACGVFDFRLAQEPIRRQHRSDLQYLMARVRDINFDEQKVLCEPAFDGMEDQKFEVGYDKIIIAPGCNTSTFGIPGVAEHAIFMKTVQDATALRNRIRDNLEKASLPNTSEDEQKKLLHVAIVGGGPTGIEIAAELSDLFRDDLGRVYKHVRDKMSVTVHDVSDQILSPFDAKLSEYATKSLNAHRVNIKTRSMITKVTADNLETKEGVIPYGMLIWTAGNKHVPLTETLQVRKSTHGFQRILTDDRLHVLKEDGTLYQNAFALGDAADIEGGELPTTAQVALQKARYLVRQFNGLSKDQRPFDYEQKSLITYTGGKDGVIAGKKDYSGYAAWLGWRSGNLMWTRSWRRKFMITLSYILNWFDGRDIARK